MRVLQVYRTYFPDTQGGLEEVIRQICRNTGRAVNVDDPVKNRVMCLTRTSETGAMRRPEAAVVRVKQHAEIASCGLSACGFRAFERQLEWADIVHYHHPWPFADMLHIAGRVTQPTVVTYHSDIVRQRFLGRLYAPLMHRFLSRVDRIVCTSPNYLASSKVLAHHTDRTDVIPIGIDPAAYPEASSSTRAAVHEAFGEGFMLFVGVLRYYKGLHVLLEALKGAGVRCVIAGQGPEEKNLKSQAARLGLDNLVFAGRVDDETKVALIDAAAAFVLPSYLRSEAFGVVLLEAAMRGKPLISTDAGTGTSYVNVDGETGVVVPPDDADALRSAMQQLTDARAQKELGKNAKARFEREFTGEAMGRRYRLLYEELLGARA